VSRKRAIPENSTISSKRASISALRMPRTAPFRKMFSRPVSSGWNPVPISSSDPTRPRMTARPSVGAVIRDRIFRSVDLPAPFAPTRPSTSPRRSSNDTSSSAQMPSWGRRSRRRRSGAVSAPARTSRSAR
jgi:hypothetical protein